ncbi:hypothetical protein TanjilG_11572 [Lupinus angustifolius]|uniref:Uncharacterized protein n=1 Tax=Lupinus angustifolius TaxID=3871 RepID=A0A1J7GCQ0_LUPAN|nr:PREDICTED: uncharacterized protein LOC109326049 isoform X1 [Lupinus angustifolius]OIV98175.1 hypothetical protein TanjilG_11572 [Lupinus angustifolius]
MATAAFKSTTKRTPVKANSSTDDSITSTSTSTSVHRQRRSRSLSQFSRPLHAPDTKGKFVNTVRGSGFPEISLDDLAIEFFDSADRGRSGSRSFEPKVSPSAGTASQRRGRSVSRKSSGGVDDRRSSIGGSGRAISDANSRRRRSVSVIRYQISDSESDIDHSQNSRSRMNLKNTDNGNKVMQKLVSSDRRPVLRKSLSQKDFKTYDGYSSQSSVLTDDEGAGAAYFNKDGTKKLRPIYKPKKVELPDMDNGLHKTTGNESRHMRTEQAVVRPRTSTSSKGDRMLSNNSDVIKAVSSIRRNYESELEQSEKRKQDLLAEVVFEEQRGRELSKIVNDLIPATKNDSIQKPSRTRKRSNDRSRMSMRLTEEAEKYIEDFISNVEDTDISSLDGERSDANSSIGGLLKSEAFNSPPMLRSLPDITDGVALPWLQWESGNGATPTTGPDKAQLTPIPDTASSTQEITKAQDQNSHSVFSHGRWSPDLLQEYIGKDVFSKSGEPDPSLSAKSKWLSYDMDDYLKVKSTEDLIIERWMQQQRINSGTLLLCNLRLF